MFWCLYILFIFFAPAWSREILPSAGASAAEAALPWHLRGDTQQAWLLLHPEQASAGHGWKLLCVPASSGVGLRDLSAVPAQSRSAAMGPTQGFDTCAHLALALDPDHSSAPSSGGCEPRAWPPLVVAEVKILFSPRHRPLGGLNLGTGWRPQSSLSCSSPPWGVLPASALRRCLTAAAHFCCDQLPKDNN